MFGLSVRYSGLDVRLALASGGGHGGLVAVLRALCASSPAALCRAAYAGVYGGGGEEGHSTPPRHLLQVASHTLTHVLAVTAG